MIALDALDRADPAAFAAALHGVFEHAPWVAQRAADGRPYATIGDLHDAMMAVVERSAPEERLAFLNGHPELGGSVPADGLTPESAAEQAGLSMAASNAAAGMPALNRAYRERFGFPFIVCVARQTAANVLRTATHRLGNPPDAELATALAEVRHITRLRLVQLVTGPGMPKTTGTLSLHVLDVAAGRPGASMGVTLLQEGSQVAGGITDGDGRMAGLLPPGPLRQGHYELRFAVGAYFAARQQDTLYDEVPIRFVVSAAEAHYHIPLLVAPWAYSTYRGS